MQPIRSKRVTSSKGAILALALLAPLLSAACQETEIARTEPGSGRSRAKRPGTAGSNADRNPEGGASSTTPLAQVPAGQVVGGTPAVPGAMAGPATGLSAAGTGPTPVVPVEYPKLSFAARGYTTHDGKQMQMTTRTETSASATQLTFATVQAHVACSGISGCKQNDVDEKVRAGMLGSTPFQRASKDEVRAAHGDAGAKATAWAIFVKQATSKAGITYTFDRPLPVYPWPRAQEDYAQLDGGALTYTATAEASRYVPNSPAFSLETLSETLGSSLANSGQALRSFPVTVTVSRSAAGAGETALTFEIQLPADRDRNLYEYFPIPRSSQYRINFQTRNIVSAETLGWFNGDRSKRPEESRLTHRLCSKSTSKGTETFPCE